MTFCGGAHEQISATNGTVACVGCDPNTPAVGNQRFAGAAFSEDNPWPGRDGARDGDGIRAR